MAITLRTATPVSLIDVVGELASWQHEGGPVQLHPGDFGWNWRVGAEALATEVREWRREDRLVAVAVVDDSGLIRTAVAPEADADQELAERLMADFEPGRGVLAGGVTSVEARFGEALRALLTERGWTAGEPWTPLHRDLTEPVEDGGLRVETVDEPTAAERVAVHRASFANATFDLEQWHRVAAGPAYADARCLLGYDSQGNAVAAATVWSAGPGRPGLLEPLGAHRDFRGHGYGTAISLAAAAALREMGASSATVCTPSANTGGVATYVAAGYERLEDSTDFNRPA